ncbi:MAG: S8 family serine peptidase [Planctomycetota bacterium]|jgi:serine protease AprX
MRTAALAVTFLSFLFLTNVQAHAEPKADPYKALRLLRSLDEAKKAVGRQDKIPVIVTFRRHVTDKEYQDIEQSLKGKFKAKYTIIPAAYAELTKGQIESLERRDVVKTVELDSAGEYVMDTATYWVGADHVNTDLKVDGSGVTVGILDSGVDDTHVDIQAILLKFLDCRDGNCVVAEPFDYYPHGTKCAATVAGPGLADEAYKGVAPGAKIIGFAVGDDRPYQSNIIAGINWVLTVHNPDINVPAAEKIRVMSFSLTFARTTDTSALDTAIRAAIADGISCVAAAGNSGPEEATSGGSPGALPEVICAGAIVDVGEDGFYVAPWSSRGPAPDGITTKPDVMAPGRYLTTVDPYTEFQYAGGWGGTSAATPFVAGVAALMIQEADNNNLILAPDAIGTAIELTAVDWGPEGKDIDYGAGIIDAYSAVDIVDGEFSGEPQLVLPSHFHARQTLDKKRNADEWTLSVDDVRYPIAITLITPDWVDSRNPDFMITLYDPTGSRVGDTRFHKSRQDTLTYNPTMVGDYTIEIVANFGAGEYFFDASAGASGLTLTSNDGNVVPVHDVAITNIDVPGEVSPGLVDVDVVVENQGGFEETTTVTLTDTTDGLLIGSQDVALAEGGSQIVHFSWDATLGSHTLRAEADPVEGETDTADNSKQTTVQVTDTPAPALGVVVTTPPGVYSVGDRVPITVVVADDVGWVQGASVHVDVTAGSGKVYGFDGTTDGQGIATFSFKIKKPDGTGTFYVDAAASMEGYFPGYGSTSFEVQ